MARILKIGSFVVFILSISKLATGVRIIKGRWKYCHDKNRLDAPGHHLCELQWAGVCQTGRRQSPIDIVKDDRIKREITDPWVFSASRPNYPILNVLNNGHTVQVSPEPNPNDFYTMSGVRTLKIS